jgi:DNA-binding transcriptional MerR regulator
MDQRRSTGRSFCGAPAPTTAAAILTATTLTAALPARAWPLAPQEIAEAPLTEDSRGPRGVSVARLRGRRPLRGNTPGEALSTRCYIGGSSGERPGRQAALKVSGAVREERANRTPPRHSRTTGRTRGRRAAIESEACYKTKMALNVSRRRNDIRELGERVFFSKDVSDISGISLRQLQWWDERKVVSPQQAEHRRLYTYQQVLEILTIAEFRQKGMSLQKTRVVLRLLRRQLGRLLKEGPVPSALYVLTDGKSVSLEEQPERILNRLSTAKSAMYLVCLSGLIQSMASEAVPRRYLTEQLRLL